MSYQIYFSENIISCSIRLNESRDQVISYVQHRLSYLNQVDKIVLVTHQCYNEKNKDSNSHYVLNKTCTKQNSVY